LRVLGLDPGEKRIGVAVSDPLGITAQGVEVITYKSLEEALARITEICHSYGVDKIIVGNPLKMSGDRGSASEKAEEFAEVLQKKLDLPVEMIDERLTSGSAEKTLLAGGVRRKKRKAVKDKLAAVLILQQYLAGMERNKDE